MSKIIYKVKRRLIRKRNIAKRTLLKQLIQEKVQAQKHFQSQLQLQNQMQSQLQTQIQNQSQAQAQVQSQLQNQSQLQAQLQGQAQAQEQLQAQLQAQVQAQSQQQAQLQATLQAQSAKETLSKIGNPVVKVTNNLNKVNSPLVAISSFRALVGDDVDIKLPIGGVAKVFYPLVSFDLGNEFDPVTSTFIPKVSGVYSINAQVNFTRSPEFFSVISTVYVRIAINGILGDIDDDTRVNLGNPNQGSSTGQTSQVSEILQLNAGDTVEVFLLGRFFRFDNGTPLPLDGRLFGGSFSGARQISPK
ncbi:hypothetical protein [Paenibacillus sp. FSL R10-2734]|uniref:hypothetical protein n=1 Tax=Paenibacillus sp. FSL R10-2734 TaxID=2954691 RepID=UPI0030D78DD1